MPVRCWVVNIPIDGRSSLPYDWYSAQPGGLLFFFFATTCWRRLGHHNHPHEQLLDRGPNDRIDYDIKQPGEGWETEAERERQQMRKP